MPARLQQLHLVDPAPVLAFEFELEDLTRMLALQALEQRRQRQHLAGEHCGASVIVIALATGPCGALHQCEQQQSGLHGAAGARGRRAVCGHAAIVGRRG